EREALFVECPSGSVIRLPMHGKVPTGLQRFGTHGCGHFATERQQRVKPLKTFASVPPDIPESPNRANDLEARVGPTALNRPFERGPEVIVLSFESVEPHRLGWTRESGRRLSCQRGAPLEVPVFRVGELPRGCQLGDGVLANCLE